MEMLPTSRIELQSTLHGEERRFQRDISKRDLQAAVKYGTRERGFPCPQTGRPRWKYTYADIVYITNETSKVEVTSWTLELPLSRKIIPQNYLNRHAEAANRVHLDPSIITSHTILIVDMSGSMKQSDMNGHKTRARGVYYNLAEQFVAGSLPPLSQVGAYNAGKARSFTDVVTLLEMHDAAEVVFVQEPISWVLYNKFVERAESKGTHNHGNYYPCFEHAFAFLDEHLDQDKCALSIFFFSDGRPSDYTTGRGLSNFPFNLYNLISAKTASYRGRFSFFAIGFGQSGDEFSIMREMVQSAQRAGAKGMFGSSYHNDTLLSTTLTSLTTTLTEARTLLSRLDLGNASAVTREKVNTNKYSITEQANKFAFNTRNWRFFNDEHALKGRVQLQLDNNETTGGSSYKWVPVSLQNTAATGLAVSKAYFAEGAERIVFLMNEVDKYGQIIGQALVAKESLYKQKRNDLKYLRCWHRTFVKTQIKAAELANKFNNRLDDLGVSQAIPRIEFLACSVYECYDAVENKEYAFLAEPRLDPSCYMKWNNNAGGVDGIEKINLRAVRKLAAILEEERVEEQERKGESKFAAIGEGDEDEKDGNDDREDELVGPTKFLVPSPSRLRFRHHLEDRILESDIPQAFSHRRQRAGGPSR
ncbi:hypothetical protein EON65_51000 [archaeon]|nr:MAG: hypothetical protein EON65_51000 [archaeon]